MHRQQVCVSVCDVVVCILLGANTRAFFLKKINYLDLYKKICITHTYRFLSFSLLYYNYNFIVYTIHAYMMKMMTLMVESQSKVTDPFPFCTRHLYTIQLVRCVAAEDIQNAI